MQSINTKSIVFYNGSTKRSSCGYCKKENSSFSNGMWASSLSVGAYQDMIDRGWRRAGKYCYKALMEKTCCPLYTIRCEALNVELSKSQKKIIKRVTTFLKNGECQKNPVNIEQVESEPIMKYKLEDIQNHDDKMKITNTDYLFDEEQSGSVINSHNSTLVTTNKEDSKMVVPLNLSCSSDTKKETKKLSPAKELIQICRVQKKKNYCAFKRN
ncbi:arginyl-tRNA--protein transferase 1 [Acyrthosiphon pisum]|uniref:N-end aminoacyl transferase N-terminal domain-containing protein n=1 Tax=Acyrthosiphon pisum TaxID=7029 RepID=A0A8R1W4G6_ACYPI|nr:arginyl-tRNA--protein transferase 1 [Acyrthosiphon pisum]XP_008187358.1 arginyl-tRNA--protein transferase 1 [Acyrthosiphon pisum]|eukprot:XP_001944839.2 PREDICTED: arginyl-tRNA--protein transferase 1 [Acyrthosiphon pisum]